MDYSSLTSAPYHKSKTSNTNTGYVYIVGAGPGDPDLLTIKAYKCLQQVDIVLYDRLVHDDILSLIPTETQTMFVGKACGKHAVSQQEINKTLIELAHQGLKICRLKGGDPYIFGRGGEEAEALVDASVNFEVIPGITAASGCSSYAGIPLTHREHAQSVRFITGHLQQGVDQINWQEYVSPSKQTLVVYMGIKAIERMCKELIKFGMPSSTPTAIIHKGTTKDQQILTCTLANFSQQVKASNIPAPSLIIIGDVVSLHNKLIKKQATSKQNKQNKQKISINTCDALF